MLPRVIRALILGLLVVLGTIGVSIVLLDHQIVREFEARRWSEPARVYAEPLELYAGLRLGQDAVEQELRRAGYRRVAVNALAPGSYSVAPGRLTLNARAVRFYDGLRPATGATLEFDSTGVSGVRDAHGEVLDAFRLDPLLIGSIFAAHGEDRIVLGPDDIPPLLPATLKLVEDRNFESHIGISFTGIVRALWMNLRAGEIEQGGSTITQQLVRSYFLNNRQTLTRKLKEALMAVLLDAHFSKRDIMTAYVNEVYLGQDGNRAVHGFGLASQFYFGKAVNELDLEQLALLVALVRGPSYYEPRRHPDRVLARRNLVLRLMGEFHLVSADAARLAAAKPLAVTGGAGPHPGYYPSFIDLVRRTLRRDYQEADLTESGLMVFSTLDPRVQAQAERALGDELTRLDKVSRTRQGTRATPGGLEGVVVVTAPQSGDVIALIGSRQTGVAGFNRALDAKRPIGSLVKPAVYLTALETGRYTPATVVDDVPIDVPLANGQVWKPQNLTPEAHGPVPMVRALAQSMNLATVHIGMDVGVPQVAQTLEALGLGHIAEPVPAILLGAVSAAPIQVAAMYNTLANGGFRTPLRAVRAVVDPRGTALRAFELEAKGVADPAATYELDEMLVEVVDRGSAASARARLPANLVVAGKTGTSSDYRDSWFAGFSGSHLVVVWVGRDDNAPTNLTGSSGALVIWTSLMSTMKTSSWRAALPDSLDEVWIDWSSGELADPQCSSDVVVVALPKGADPPVKPGCAASGAGAAPGSERQDFITRAREWLRRLVR
jgi:penicillin-binding protein 1B